MVRDPVEIERAFRRVRWENFFLDLRRSWISWALFSALIAGIAYLFASPMHVVGTVHGATLGAHLPPSEDNNSRTEVSVRLDDGSIVIVTLPRGVLYRRGSAVDLAIVRRDWPPHITTYTFVRYSE